MALNRRLKTKERLKIFLEHAQSDTGGYYKHLGDDAPCEFLRPLSGVWVRVRRLDTGERLNVHFENLSPMNELEALAYLMDVVPKEEEIPHESITDPQESGDIDFLT